METVPNTSAEPRLLLLPGSSESTTESCNGRARAPATGTSEARVGRGGRLSLAYSAESTSRDYAELLKKKNELRVGNPALAQLASVSSLLMLQGPLGPLFERIADWKRRRGQQVRRVVFNGGDGLYCPDADAIDFLGDLAEWPSFLRRCLLRHRVDGLLLFGQTRPYHQEAIRICHLMGVQVFVMEEGYIRPGFMTLELGGVNALSTTLDAFDIDETATVIEPHPAKVERHRWKLTGHAMRYYAGLQLLSRRYPRYVHHRHNSIPRYAHYWIRAAMHWPITRLQDKKALARLDVTRPYFFMPLQLDSDAQIVFHSRYLGIMAFVDEVLESFAAHAPKDAQLLFKQHPLARGNTGMRKKVLAKAGLHGLSHRVIFVYSCRIYQLLDKVSGVVTVNSTVGLQAIAHGAALKVMGEAIYDHPDVVDQQPLNDFWRNPRKPDPAKASQFHRKLKVLTQVPAALYDSASVPLQWDALLSHASGEQA